MPFTISIELLTGSYDAAEVDDRDRAEWPPHPARLFCALLAAARGDGDRSALRWLEAQPAPVIRAAAQAGEARRSAYVVVNTVNAKGGNLTHPGRTNGLRTRTRALPTFPRVALTWAAEAPVEVVGALDAMARRIPYLGRSTGITLVAASTTDRPAGDGELFEPCDLLDRELALRIPYPGFLDELDAQFTAGRPAWEVSRYQGYRQVREAPEAGAPEIPSVYEDVVVFGFSGLKPQGRLTVRFTEALRSAVLRAAGRRAPEVLHGHGADGRPHVAFLALPDVGHRHADGHLLGMAVAVPDLPADERKAVLRAVLGLRGDHDLIEFTVPGIGGVQLIYQPGHVRPWGASPDRWRQGSRRWATATPIVLDRYPKRPEQLEAEVRAGLRRVGLPDPVTVDVSTNPLLPGAVPLRPIDLPRQARGKLFRHVAVTFDRTLHGPVLVGAGRYLGVGLLAPVGRDA
ncbi:MAG: type I-U CRISPR-associated protein Cas5/Cas6 [Pseudonocardia sp.]|nr:type I-U CRISPR-associated protein Cas5/Cas6 [Pseudonocardia sp.]